MITAGQRVRILPEHQDEDYIWTAHTDENPHTGYFRVCVTDLDGGNASYMEMYSYMVEPC